MQNLTTLSTLWYYYLDSFRALAFLFTTAFRPPVQTSLPWTGQLRSSYNSENRSWFPWNGFRNPHRPLWTTLLEKLTQIYIQNNRCIEFGLVGEERRRYRQWDHQIQTIRLCVFSPILKESNKEGGGYADFHRREWASGGLSHSNCHLPCYNWNYVCLALMVTYSTEFYTKMWIV